MTRGILLLVLPCLAFSADIRFRYDAGSARANVWGDRNPGYARTYFNELLPALFERTLELETWQPEGGSLEWMFTGARGGFTVELSESKVRLYQRYYDSPALKPAHTPANARTARHPEFIAADASAPVSAAPRTLSISLDYRMRVTVALDGRPLLEQTTLLDVSRHQLAFTPARENAGQVAGRLLDSPARRVSAAVRSARRHQRILGFGGITTPTAYAQLSPQGKQRWWKLLEDYNLLIQREYPNGVRLNPAMDNWDRLSDASPHYYGDNFPNGEISDFDYLRELRRRGGKVIFQFWQLPPWARRDWTDSAGKIHKGAADPARYAEAMVRYCQISRERTGAAPEIVGIQNEIIQPGEVWEQMTVELRRALDRAGFQSVKIHMADASNLKTGLVSARTFRALPLAWPLLDYSATHMYDFQPRFTDPDAYDAMLAEWRAINSDKPFLSTELCVNDRALQTDSYRTALAMAQLYHKNLELVDAVFIAYCWLLLNVEQPSYGWTRSLFVPDARRNFEPVPSSHHLRTFGAFSRHLREGMVRVEVERAEKDLLITAYEGPKGQRTVVALNRSTIPVQLELGWPAARFTRAELADPYHENDSVAVGIPIPPGAILTLFQGTGR